VPWAVLLFKVYPTFVGSLRGVESVSQGAVQGEVSCRASQGKVVLLFLLSDRSGGQGQGPCGLPVLPQLAVKRGDSVGDAVGEYGLELWGLGLGVALVLLGLALLGVEVKILVF
jgi:hypothetical protein